MTAIAVQTQLFGKPSGGYKDDLASVGGWPATQNIQQITKIVVHFGEILDGLEITYKTPSGLKTVQHGGKGGNEKVLDFKENQSIVGVYGRYDPSQNFYGNGVIAEISFIVATTDKNVREPVSVLGPFGTPPTSFQGRLLPYQVNGTITAFASYSGSYTAGLSFYKTFTADNTNKVLDI